MGLLDDAIREHLELKRRHGADPAEVERLEQEALGPVRHRGEYAPAPVDITPHTAFGEEARLAEDDLDEPRYAGDEPVAYDEEATRVHEVPAPRGDLKPGGDSAYYDDDEYEDDEEYEEDELPAGADPLQPPTAQAPAPEAPAGGGGHGSAPPAYDSADEYDDEEYEDDDYEDDLPATAAGEPAAAAGPGSFGGAAAPEYSDEALTEIFGEPAGSESPREEAAGGEPPAADQATQPFSLPPEEGDPRGELWADDETEESPGQETAAFSAEEVAEASRRGEPGAEEGEGAGSEEDVLEETPEFLQETPEHDRLWFEQRPPRGFDFEQ